jgi:Chaperone of endosialidase
MDRASEALFSLKPATFRYKKEIDPSGTLQFGLVAEDVEKINSQLVIRDESGRVNSIRYNQVNAMSPMSPSRSIAGSTSKMVNQNSKAVGFRNKRRR